jgi:hypothetical protein
VNPELSYAPHPDNTESEPSPKNFFGRLFGIWFSPGETFPEIGRAPRVLIPTLVFIALAGGSSYSLTDRYGYENIVRKQMESAVNTGLLPQDIAEEAIRQATTPDKVIQGKIRRVVFTAIGMVAVLLVNAGLFKGFSLLMGAENEFKRVYSVTAYAFVAVSLISTIVFVVSIYLKDPADIDIYNPTASNLGALLSTMVDGAPKFVLGLASYIDVFSVWRLILLTIGYTKVTRKMKTGTAATFLVVFYCVMALIGAALTSLLG